MVVEQGAFMYMNEQAEIRTVWKELDIAQGVMFWHSERRSLADSDRWNIGTPSGMPVQLILPERQRTEQS